MFFKRVAACALSAATSPKASTATSALTDTSGKNKNTKNNTDGYFRPPGVLPNATEPCLRKIFAANKNLIDRENIFQLATARTPVTRAIVDPVTDCASARRRPEVKNKKIKK